MQMQREYAEAWTTMPRQGGWKQQGMAGRAGWWRETLCACGVYEGVTLGYLAVTNVLLVLFHRNLETWWQHFLLHAAIAAAIVLLVRAAANSTSTSLHFARHWYPFALFIYFFEELHSIVHLVVPRWLDTWVIHFDYAMFGVHPTVWLQQFASPALNDAMQFFYMTYYLYTIVLCGLLFARKEARNFWVVINATAIAYVIGYVIAIAIPMEGPFHTLRALHHVELTGGFFTALIGVVQNFGRVHGAAFPSLHVAGAFVAVLGAWRFRRALFWIYLPLFVGMMLSTVYGRYHYAADIWGGLIIGGIGWMLARRAAMQKAIEA